MNGTKILIVEDEYPIQELLKFILLTLTKKENNYEKIIKLQFNNDCICNDVYN